MGENVLDTTRGACTMAQSAREPRPRNDHAMRVNRHAVGLSLVALDDLPTRPAERAQSRRFPKVKLHAVGAPGLDPSQPLYKKRKL